MLAKRLLIFLMLMLVAGCTSIRAPRVAHFQQVSFKELEGWADDAHQGALRTFQRSCERILRVDFESTVSRATALGGSAIDWQVPCMEALRYEEATDDEAKKFFERWFVPYMVLDETMDTKGTLTGYFQIEMDGSLKKHGQYRYPVYRKPENLEQIKGSAEIAHCAINNGVLKGKGLEVAYVDNRARLYMMHIQGSGRVKLKEGGHLNLGFDDHNGYRFSGISSALQKRELNFRSYQQMLDFLHRNPEEGRKIIEEDPSYVFFRKVEGQYAVGGHGVQLEPERSLAVDYELYPYGTPIWVSAELPEQSMFKGRGYRRLFIAQDTGGVIRGAIRADVFFGSGASAEKVASHFKVKGRMFALFPRTVEVPNKYKSK